MVSFTYGFLFCVSWIACFVSCDDLTPEPSLEPLECGLNARAFTHNEDERLYTVFLPKQVCPQLPADCGELKW